MFLPLVPLLLVGCKPDFDTITHDWALESGLAFTDCGDVELGQCSVSLGLAPQTIVCLQEGYAACEAVRARITQDSVEGDPITEVWYVVPADDGTCSLMGFRDTTLDEFGPQEITRFTCAGLTPVENCPWFETDGCSDPLETW